MSNKYISPLTNRYGSDEMKYIFSDENKYRTWRYLWFLLAKCESYLGIDITDEQLDEMYKNINNIDYKLVKEYEEVCKHDVMAHLKEFCSKCPKAEPIIHLGATSCYVTDNTDILLMSDATKIILNNLDILTSKLARFCRKYADTITMAYTHLQPAQPTTVGKRGCMWLQDLDYDYRMLQYHNSRVDILGCNGATGTQASFLSLLNGNKRKVEELNELLAGELVGDSLSYLIISGQTYTRKIDSVMLDVLSGIAQSLCKMCGDIRLLQSRHELSEPFGSGQIGSSAMAYKQNPIMCENVSSLARHIISLTMTAKMNTCTQWLERSLDDSANRRLIIPEAFILTDHIIRQCIKIIDGISVNEQIINKNIDDNLPFVMMEDLIMQASKAGISRQYAHQRIRDLSVIAMDNVSQGKGNNLIQLINEDETLGDIIIEIDKSRIAGMASRQVKKYLCERKMKNEGSKSNKYNY